MREIVILLLVVALIVLVIGAVNQDQRVDVDYVFGTWEDVSVLSLSAVCAGAAVVLGLVIAAMARTRVVSDRRKLEHELQHVYPRLRDAERAAGLPARNPPVEAAAMPVAAVVPVAAPLPPEVAGGEEAPIEPAPEVAGAQPPDAPEPGRSSSGEA